MPIPLARLLPDLLNADLLVPWARELVKQLNSALGSFRLPLFTLTLANGANNNVSVKGGLFAVVAGPTGAFNITGLGGGETGRLLVLVNPIAQNMTLSRLNGGSSSSNQIETCIGGDLVSAGISSALLVYYTKWYVVSWSA